MEVKRLMALVPVAVLRMLNTGTLNCVVTGNKKAKLIVEQIYFFLKFLNPGSGKAYMR
jgi:hypothetical protein